MNPPCCGLRVAGHSNRTAKAMKELRQMNNVHCDHFNLCFRIRSAASCLARGPIAERRGPHCRLRGSVAPERSCLVCIIDCSQPWLGPALWNAVASERPSGVQSGGAGMGLAGQPASKRDLKNTWAGRGCRRSFELTRKDDAAICSRSLRVQHPNPAAGSQPSTGHPVDGVPDLGSHLWELLPSAA